MIEHWIDVPDHPGYQVSDHGRLRSAWERGGPRRWRIGEVWTVLNPATSPAGYQVAYLRDTSGKRKLWGVHQLVALAFVGPCPVGMEVLHRDDVGTHNALTNLRYGTSKENRQDEFRNSGPSKGNKKLTEDQVRAIRADPRGPVAVADAYGMDYSSIYNIRAGRTWANLS